MACILSTACMCVCMHVCMYVCMYHHHLYGMRDDGLHLEDGVEVLVGEVHQALQPKEGIGSSGVDRDQSCEERRDETERQKR